MCSKVQQGARKDTHEVGELETTFPYSVTEVLSEDLAVHMSADRDTSAEPHHTRASCCTAGEPKRSRLAA